MRHHPQILAATEQGTPFQWISWEDAVTQKCKNNIAYEMGNEDQIFGGISRMTGKQSHIEVGSIIFIKGKFKHSTKTPTLTNINLFRRDLHTCSYCGKHFNEQNLTRDHIVPSSKGGLDTWMNCVAACKRCNNRKDSMTLEESGLELLWLPYTPNRAEALILSNRHIMEDQAAFIAGFIPKHSRVPKYLEQHCGITI